MVALLLTFGWCLVAGYAFRVLVEWHRDPYRERGSRISAYFLRRRLRNGR